MLVISWQFATLWFSLGIGYHFATQGVLSCKNRVTPDRADVYPLRVEAAYEDI